MSDHDIQVLSIGFELGVYLVLLALLVGSVLDDRRGRKAAAAAQAKFDAARRQADGPDVVDTYTDPALIGKAGRP